MSHLFSILIVLCVLCACSDCHIIVRLIQLVHNAHKILFGSRHRVYQKMDLDDRMNDVYLYTLENPGMDNNFGLETEAPTNATYSTNATNTTNATTAINATNRDQISTESKDVKEKIYFRIVKGSKVELGAIPFQIGFKQEVLTIKKKKGKKKKKKGTHAVQKDDDKKDDKKKDDKKKDDKKKGDKKKKKDKVVIQRFKDFFNFCGGTLIARTAILTAAHCFRQDHWFQYLNLAKVDIQSNAILKKYWAVAGNIQTDIVQLDGRKAANKTGQWRRLKSVKIHPLHDGVSHDIAVVHVTVPFILNKNVKIIPMASKFHDINTKCQASGFGCINIKTRKDSNYLMSADIQLISAKQCNNIWSLNMRRMLCAADKVNNICYGDSGGPLLCKGTKDRNDRGGNGVIVGIACAIGTDDAFENRTLFTRISKYSRKFIDAEVKKG